MRRLVLKVHGVVERLIDSSGLRERGSKLSSTPAFFWTALTDRTSDQGKVVSAREAHQQVGPQTSQNWVGLVVGVAVV